MSPTATDTTSATATASPITTADAAICSRCGDSGWADPWELHDGSPELVSCHWCLGTGAEDCPACEGEGALATPTPCTCEPG